MEYVINKCFGGFGLSDKAFTWLIENKGWKTVCIGPESTMIDLEKFLQEGFNLYKHPAKEGTLIYCGNDSDLLFRSNPDVIECIKNLGKEANGEFASLKIVNCDLPQDQLMIDDYDGNEVLQTIPTVFES